MTLGRRSKESTHMFNPPILFCPRGSNNTTVTSALDSNPKGYKINPRHKGFHKPYGKYTPMETSQTQKTVILSKNSNVATFWLAHGFREFESNEANTGFIEVNNSQPIIVDQVHIIEDY